MDKEIRLNFDAVIFNIPTRPTPEIRPPKIRKPCPEIRLRESGKGVTAWVWSGGRETQDGSNGLGGDSPPTARVRDLGESVSSASERNPVSTALRGPGRSHCRASGNSDSWRLNNEATTWGIRTVYGLF